MKLSLPIRRLRPPFIRSIPYRLLVFSLCALCVLCGQVFAQDWKTLKDGIEYAEVTKEISGLKVNMNLLRLDLTKVRLDVHHAMDAAIGTEKTSSIATRHGAFAAINAGFFRLDTSIWAGDSAGLLMVNGDLLSESIKDRESLIVLNGDARETHLLFGHYQSKAWIQFGEKTWGSFFELSGINRERKASEAVLYNGSVFKKLIMSSGNVELRLNKCKALPFLNSSDAEKRCEDVEIIEDGATPKLKNPQLVVFLDKEFASANSIQEKIKAFKTLVTKTIIVRTRIKDGNIFPFTAANVDITNGIPQLIKNGKIDITWQEEKSSKSFVETRHPRTAVAKLKDGKFLMITVDGRTESSGGIGLQDLAECLLSLGATDAMNLDGGGSTTMFVDGKVVNHPSDKEGERKVSDAILVTPRVKK